MTRYKNVLVILVSVAVVGFSLTMLSGLEMDTTLILATALGSGVIGGAIGKAMLRAHLRTELHQLRRDVAIARDEDKQPGGRTGIDSAYSTEEGRNG